MSNPFKKTMVYFGLAEDVPVEENNNETAENSNVSTVAAPSVNHSRAAVTPLRKVSMKASHVNNMNEILTVVPKSFGDAKMIAVNYKENVPIILNLTQLSDQDSRRMLDFVAGLKEGLDGSIEKVTTKVFLLLPATISVSSISETSEN